MKTLGFVLLAVLATVSTVALAQEHSNMQKPSASPVPTSSQKAVPTETQQNFARLKTLAGSWEGPVTLDPLMPGMTEQPIPPLHLTIRVTSRGNAIVHEFQEANTPLDPSKYDHPVTMLYLDNDQLNLVHYCDAGNRPHMVARPSADGKTVEFDFVDLSGGNQHGHMYHAVFTLVDADHHIEDWTYMLPGDKPMHAHFELKRIP